MERLNQVINAVGSEHHLPVIISFFASLFSRVDTGEKETEEKREDIVSDIYPASLIRKVKHQNH